MSNADKVGLVVSFIFFSLMMGRGPRGILIAELGFFPSILYFGTGGNLHWLLVLQFELALVGAWQIIKELRELSR